MIVAVTGHRPDKLGGWRTPNSIYNSVMEGLDRTLLTIAPERVKTGMALGVDQWMAELCYWNGIPFDACIPCDGQESQWPTHAQIKYRELLRKAATVHVVCPGPYASWKMQARNEYMVDHAARLIAVWDGSDGGTANCVRYAMSRNKPIVRVNFRRPNGTQAVNVPRSVGASTPDPVIRPAAEVLRQIPVPVRAIAPVESEGVLRARAAARARIRQEEEEEAQERRRMEREARERIERSNARTIVEVEDQNILDVLEAMVAESNRVTTPRPVNSRRRRGSPAPAAEIQVPSIPVPEKPTAKTQIAEFGRILDLDV